MWSCRDLKVIRRFRSQVRADTAMHSNSQGLRSALLLLALNRRPVTTSEPLLILQAGYWREALLEDMLGMLGGARVCPVCPRECSLVLPEQPGGLSPSIVENTQVLGFSVNVKPRSPLCIKGGPGEKGLKMLGFDS